MTICRTDRLYHYLLGGDQVLASIMESGLLPLSALPDCERQRDLNDFYRDLYAKFAQPILKRPYQNSGIFLTPIDFRSMSGTSLSNRARVVVPLSAINPNTSVLTYEMDGRRVTTPCDEPHLQAVAQVWTEERIRAWFGRNPQMMFYFVPQVAVYQDGPIRVESAWIEQPA